MIMNIKKFLLIVFCFLPSVCCAVGLDTEIAWEPWAINIAVMNFCMPELEDGKKLTKNGISVDTSHSYLYDKNKLSSLGNVPMMVTNWNVGGIIHTETVTFIPKCSAFIDSYVAQIEKHPKVSLNQIISMCLDTIEDKLICENIVLMLVNLTENKDTLKEYDVQKMGQKVQDSIKANHTICSPDDKFCTTYSLFTTREDWASLKNVDGDAIYTTTDQKIIGMCAGVNHKDVGFLSLEHGNSRCITTANGYELYEFDITDLTEESIILVYVDYGDATNVVKKHMEQTKEKMQTLEQCVTKTANVDTNRALNNNMGSIAFGLALCEKDNSTPDTVFDCKVQVLKSGYKQTMQNLQELSFEKAEKNLDKYKSMLYEYALDAQVLRHQTELLLTDYNK